MRGFLKFLISTIFFLILIVVERSYEYRAVIVILSFCPLLYFEYLERKEKLIAKGIENPAQIYSFSISFNILFAFVFALMPTKFGNQEIATIMLLISNFLVMEGYIFFKTRKLRKSNI